MKKTSWFYPVPKKSKHEICLNYGETECCIECYEEWCKYGQHELTKEIMDRDERHYDSPKQRKKPNLKVNAVLWRKTDE